MDDLAAMRVYVRVVERGSMSAAARDLAIGQPAVSERIERLEARLGVRLLRRNTRTLSATDSGAVFYERAKLAVEAADDALAVGHESASLTGTIRIAAPHAVGEVLLTPILLRFRARHPGIRIDLVLNDRVVDPITEGVDLSLRLGDPGVGGFAARRLGRVDRVLVATPAYLERHGTPREPGDLHLHAFARVSGLFNRGRLPLTAADGRALATPINVAFSVSHWRPLHAIILGDGAIGVLQRPVCNEDLTAGRLTRLLPAYVLPGFVFHVLYPTDRPLARCVLTFLSSLESEVSGLT